MDSRDRLASDPSGSERESWSERGAFNSGGGRRKSGRSSVDRSKQDRLAASVRTKGSCKSFEDEDEGGPRRAVAKHPAQGSDGFGPRNKNANMPDLKIEADQRRAEHKVANMPDLKIEVDQR